ncbi:lectin-like domain-containing protein [Telluribacter sp. SYSU D00476]|uniref:lectin-like domain-containing protein n=1 Tax=Telluribacter sp. SYSU D00476 TaxID=2811430 RepID=UPI001FF57907|nr:gliding motility-associated C-terminal domain-containing protein [Telluribacter sp. SYSU D00476]
MWLCCAGGPLHAQYNLLGSTTAIGGDCYRLTEDKGWQSGAVWYSDTLDITASFDIEFTMNFGNNDTDGADGMVFVMQTRGNNALGTRGHGLGFEDFKPSLGIEFDTHENRRESNDPGYDHIAVLRDGNINHSSPHNLAGPVRASRTSRNIEDGKDHLVRVVWTASQRTLDVYFDCEKRLSAQVDMQSIFGRQSRVWWGFTGGTGQLSNNQVVCLSRDIVVKDQYRGCKGEPVQLLARSSSNGVYKWSPAALLDNPTSQSPVARPTKDQVFTVEYLDRCNRPVRETVFVKVAAPFTVELGTDRVLCNRGSTTLAPVVSATSLSLDYRWSTGSTQPSLTTDTSGLYVLTVSAGACEAKDSVEVVFQSEADVRALPIIQNYCYTDQPLSLSASSAREVSEYYWSHSAQTDPSVWVNDPGTYELITTTESGCKFRETFIVKDDCYLSVWVPSAFSPNADGQNDVLRIGSSRPLELWWTIYDRWGSVIYHSQDMAAGWDGYYKGRLCPPGAYAWRAQYRLLGHRHDPYHTERGIVWIIR